MGTEESLRAAPVDDFVARLALADCLEEQGNVVEAAFQRWLAVTKKRPGNTRNELFGDLPSDCFGWSNVPVSHQWWQKWKPWRLQASIFDALGGEFEEFIVPIRDYRVKVWKSVKEAEQAIFNVFVARPGLF